MYNKYKAKNSKHQNVYKIYVYTQTKNICILRMLYLIHEDLESIYEVIYGNVPNFLRSKLEPKGLYGRMADETSLHYQEYREPRVLHVLRCFQERDTQRDSRMIRLPV